MEEKEHEPIPKPGVPEALDPNIGNGAMWESHAHDSILRSVDPLSKLDHLLLDETTRQKIIDRWNGKPDLSPVESIPSLPVEKVDLIPTEEQQKEIPVEKDQQFSTEKKAKKLKKKRQKLETQSAPLSSETIPPPTDPEVTREFKAREQTGKIGKVGKRVRKVIKTVQEEHDQVILPVDPDKITSSVDALLSPFTQWLKSLRGSEYVHPYGDDYGLEQMAATARGGVSETFADLLASQGHKDQALRMYMQLMEKYPEKSSFFAAKIEALK